MLWITLAVSAAFILLTMVLFLTGLINSGWYAIGAVVYAVVFAIAIIGYVTEPETEAKPAEPIVRVRTEVREQKPEVRQPRPREPLVVEERAIYSTRTGQVYEITTSAGGKEERDYTIETGGRKSSVEDVEDKIRRRKWTPAERPTDGKIRSGLRRWGQIREVN